MVELIVIGNELLSGVVVDTNSAWLLGRLYDRGILATRKTLVLDERADIAQVLRDAAGRSRVVVCCGGLGPTADDLTAEAAAMAAGVEVVQRAEARWLVTDAVRQRGMNVSPRQLKQARLPLGSRILPNPKGTAPGFALQMGACTAFFLPGPPVEFKAMAEAEVLPFIDAEGIGEGAWASETVRTFGLPESRLADAVEASGVDLQGIELGYQLDYPEALLRLRVPGESAHDARRRCEAAAAGLEAALAPFAFARGAEALPVHLGAKLVEAGKTLALAESCTGGMAASLLTDVPGASRYLLLSAVTYANEMKTALLGVPAEVIAAEGAVSEACARAMAEGALARSGADYAVAITGVAGPEGGTDAKPVGTVHFALAERDRETAASHQRFTGGRDKIRRRSAFFALDLVRRRLAGLDGDAG